MRRDKPVKSGVVMVQGVGIDIVEIDRIKKLIDNYRTHFLEKVFTPREITYCSSKAHPEVHFSGRWAVKEAFYKALPLPMQPLASWKSIEILSAAGSGKPEITLLSPELVNAFKTGRIDHCHVSISHERKNCTAIVILE